MKLKELLFTDDKLHHSIHRNYNDFIDNNTPSNSIEISSTGEIISNKISILKYIDFGLTQVKYASEGKSNREFDNPKPKKKSSKKKLKDIPYNKLSLKQKKKRIKNMSHYAHSINGYPDPYSAKIP